MRNESQTVLVTTTKGGAEAIRDAIVALGGDSRASERKAFGGEVIDWVAVGSVTGAMLPKVLRFIVDVIKTQRVESIRVGEVEIRNPSRHDVEDLKAAALERLGSRSDDDG